MKRKDTIPFDQFRHISLNASSLKKTTPQVIVLVITRWNAYDNRKTIRTIFANDTDLSLTYKLVFLFNYPEDCSTEDLAHLTEESQKNQDLLLPNVEDSYKTVALKLLAAFHWLQVIQWPVFQWLVKIDDDVILNLKNLDVYLSSRKAFYLIYL